VVRPGPLLSIHLTSNRPDHLLTFFDRLELATDDVSSVEVVIKIDDTDARMNALLADQVARRPFHITSLSTPLADGFYGLWRAYDALLEATNPNAYFVVGLNDEMYFTEPGWDTRLRKYVGLYPDHIYRLRTSIHRERNAYDYWEAGCAGDLTPITTKRWLDLSGGWCPCNGPDSFQNTVAFYFGWLHRHDTFGRPYRERVVHDIEFGAYGANLDVTDPAVLRHRIRGGVLAWFTLVSHPMQQEAARRAQRLHAHIVAARHEVSDCEVVDHEGPRELAVVDRTTGTDLWRASYGISRLRIGWTNFIRTFNYPFYAGGGEQARRRRWRNLAYCLLLRHERLEGLSGALSKVACYLLPSHERLERLNRARRAALAAVRKRIARLPFGFARRRYADDLLRDAGAFVRRGEWNLARKSFRDARAVWPACADNWLHDGASRITALEEHLVSAAPASTRLRILAEHIRKPSRQSCAASMRFLGDEAERLRAAWLQYTVDQPFNVWRLLPAMGIRRIALFGGEGWGLALHRQLETAGVTCVAVIDNNERSRRTAMVPAPYFSTPEYLARGPQADAVLSSLVGDHDRDVLARLQEAFGSRAPVLSWKMLFTLLAEQPEGQNGRHRAA
jgi:hypothetical protein